MPDDPIAEEHHGDASHIACGAVDRARGEGVHELLRPRCAVRVGLGVGSVGEGAEREAGVRHAERCEDLVLHELDVARAGRRLDEGGGDGEAIVAVDAHVAGRGLEPRHRERLQDLIEVSRHGSADVGVAIVGSRKARGVIEQHPDGDALVACRSHPERRQVGDERRVEVDDAAVHELHHRDGRKHLADRADAEQRAVGSCLTCIAIGEAEGLAPDHAVGAHEGDRDRGGALLEELLGSALPFLDRSVVGRLRRARPAGRHEERRPGGKKECRHAGSGCDTTQNLTHLRPRLVDWGDTCHRVMD